MKFFFFLLTFISSVIGAISGIGGGIIIKPMLDLVSSLDAESISFLSGCTVFSMSCISLFKSFRAKQKIDFRTGTTLSFGSITGGIMGKHLFQTFTRLFSGTAEIKLIQSALLFAVTLIVLLYYIKKPDRSSAITESMLFIFLIGLLLGMISVFLGIGGGPLNLAVLSFFFAMPQKKIALNSIYIIFFSQLSAFVSMALQHERPDVPHIILILMILGGISGGYAGTSIRLHLNDRQSQKLFQYVLVFILFINIYNTLHFLTLSTFFN